MKHLPRSLGRRHALATAVLLAVSPLAVHGQTSPRTTVNWVNWITGSSTDAVGSMALPTGGNVDVTFAGQAYLVFTGAFPEPYWGPATTYTGTTYTNPPLNRDAIIIAGGPGSGRMTLSFSQAVIDPVLAIASLGLTNHDRSVNIQTAMLFEQPFEVMSNGPNFYASGQFTPFISLPGPPNALYGTESSGVIRFRGSFTELSWTSPLAEVNAEGNLVGTYLVTLGAAPCGEYLLPRLTGNEEVRLGCTAYTRGGAFDQQFQLDVRGTLRAETYYTLAGTQDVAMSARTTLQQGGLIAPAGRLTVGGQLQAFGLLDVAGRLETLPASIWSSTSGLVVQPMADVLIGGRAHLNGPTSVNGNLRVTSGGQVLGLAPLLVGGLGAKLEVQAGGNLQALAGLLANSGAQLLVGGELIVDSSIELDNVQLQVQAGGQFTNYGAGQMLATVSNAGTMTFAGGAVKMIAGAFTNSGRLVIRGDGLLLQGGVVMQNLTTGVVEISGTGGLELGGAELTNRGSISAESGSTFGISAGALLNSGTLQMNAGSQFLTPSGTVDNSGTLRIGGHFVNGGGNITNTGQLVFIGESAATSQLNQGLIVNNGNLVVQSPEPGATFVNAGRVRNQGQFTIDVEAQLENNGGQFFNLGTFTIDGLADFSNGGLIQGPGGSLVVNGTLRTDGFAPLRQGSLVAGNALFTSTGLTFEGGSIGGTGVIEGSLFLGAGVTVLPGAGGSSPGTLTVTGSVDLGDGARLALKVGRSGAHDQLRAGGFFQRIGSVVALSFIDGLRPDLDQTFDLLTVTTPGAWAYLDAGSIEGLPSGTQTAEYRSAAGGGGQTLGLAFAPAGATPLEPYRTAGAGFVWIFAGEQRFADLPLGDVQGRLTVDGTLGLRRDASLRVADAVVAANGRLLSSSQALEVVGTQAVAGEFVQRGNAVIGSVSVTAGGSWRNTGHVVLGHPDGSGAEFHNAGRVVHAAGSWRNEAVGGTAVLIDNAAGGRFDIGADMHGAARVRNAGEWRVAAGARVQDLVSFEQSAGLLLVHGELQSDTLRLTGGQLSGRGRIEGPVLLRAEAAYADPGTVLLRPGAEDGIGGGVLSFADRLEVGMGTMVEFVIGADGQASRLHLLAGADFSSGFVLRFVLAEGYLPGDETTWTIIELAPAASLDNFFQVAGAFSAVYERRANGDWQLPDITAVLRATPDGVSLTMYTVAAVPEPTSYGMMVAGLGLLTWLQRRRRLGRGAF